MKSIPTTYNGVKYRSRVEARWAVFFDAMGWPATYEQEGFDLDGVWYLPDFWLSSFGIYVEIKADEPLPEELEKCRRLALLSGKLVWLLAGSPGKTGYKLHEFAEDGTQAAAVMLREFRDCRRCDRTVIYEESETDKLHQFAWKEIGERCHRADCADRLPGHFNCITKAIDRATNERFGVHA